MNLSVRDVAVRLNVSEKTVYKWLKAGLIPANRISKSWIITEESV
ncbi:MAG TPA: helix-turn-helix domain-containing protein, partial [Dehalococcoidia bacterium]|nr:helix-turn-helix domain-containing protein [Dehalococcoidia bacterium]